MEDLSSYLGELEILPQVCKTVLQVFTSLSSTLSLIFFSLAFSFFFSFNNLGKEFKKRTSLKKQLFSRMFLR